MITKKENTKRYIKCLVSGFWLLFMIIITGCGRQKDTSNKTYADMRAYFKMSAYTDGDNIYNEATQGELAVVINGQVMDTRAFIYEDKPYIDIEYVNDYINDGVYWDNKEERCLYALPLEEISITYGEKSYIQDNEDISFDNDIIIKHNNKTFVLLDFVKKYTALDEEVITEGVGRVVINTRYGDTSFVTAKSQLKLRAGENASFEILSDISKDTRLRYIEAGQTEGWYVVETTDGITGYVMTKEVSDITNENITSDFKEIVYSSLTRDDKIVMAWQQMEYAGGNDSLASLVKDADGLNVISPTWFKLNGTTGSISSLASSAYVKKAHKKGLEVWALISDFDKDESGNYYVTQVLPYTSRRKALVSNLMKEVLECGADGINVDFEKITYAVSDDYIQFLRELSVECRKKGIVLSVDNYAPTAGNKFYNRKAQGQVVDYCIIMGYDEHWAGGNEAGSVASLPFVENGIINTISEVPANKVINAVPFFTRVWSETPEDLTDGTQAIIEDPIYGNYALSSKAVGLQAAINLLKNHKVDNVWLEELGQYYGEYKENGITYRIWLEEDESMTRKLELVNKYNIAGISCWKLGLEYSGIWDVISQCMTN